jgi:predicted O-methyltransferase YrrM
LKKLDKNGDGKLTRDEFRPQFGPPGGPGPEGREGPPGKADQGPGQGPEVGRGRGAGGRGGPGPAGFGPSATLAASPRPKDDAEEKILKVLDEVGKKQGRMMNVPMPDGRMLRLLAETIGAKTAVEIGTSNGVSALWFSLALRKTGGKLITHEIEKQRADLARENFAAAGVADLVTIVEGDAHQTVAKLTGPVDLVFIDADKEGYLDYLTKLLPLVRPGGLVLAHNMNPRMADARFVKAITTNPDLETLFYTEGGGLSITLKKR